MSHLLTFLVARANPVILSVPETIDLLACVASDRRFYGSNETRSESVVFFGRGSPGLVGRGGPFDNERNCQRDSRADTRAIASAKFEKKTQP